MKEKEDKIILISVIALVICIARYKYKLLQNVAATVCDEITEKYREIVLYWPPSVAQRCWQMMPANLIWPERFPAHISQNQNLMYAFNFIISEAIEGNAHGRKFSLMLTLGLYFPRSQLSTRRSINFFTLHVSVGIFKWHLYESLSGIASISTTKMKNTSAMVFQNCFLIRICAKFLRDVLRLPSGIQIR